NPPRLLRIGFNGAAQSQDGDIDGAIIAFALVVIARQRQEAIARQGLAGVIDERFKQIDFASCELDDVLLLEELPRGRVEHKGSESYWLILGQGRCPLFAPQDCFNAGKEFAWVERLAQIIVGPCFQADDAVYSLVASGQKNDGNVLVLGPQAPARFGTVAI